MRKLLPLLAVLILSSITSCTEPEVERAGSYSFKILNSLDHEIGRYEVLHSDSVHLETLQFLNGTETTILRKGGSATIMEQDSVSCRWTRLDQDQITNLALMRFADEVQALEPCDADHWSACDSVQFLYHRDSTKISIHFDSTLDSLWHLPQLSRRPNFMNVYVKGELTEKWRRIEEEVPLAAPDTNWTADCNFQFPEIMVDELRNALVDGNNYLMRLKASDAESEAGIHPFEVTVLRGGHIYLEEDSCMKEAEVYLPFEGEYRITISAENYLSKTLQINFDQMPDSAKQQAYESLTEIMMFRPIEGFDESLLDEPIGKCSYNLESHSIEWDFDYTSKRAQVIQASIEEASTGSSTP